ncbi:MAG: hypothetical protein JKY33_01030, partial [Bacteroidia bacterium]|nr:hypothetical protein [Bacteroidia bacterium]
MKKVTTSILLIFPICTLLVLIWGLNKGFDFTDESYYLLGYDFPMENNTSRFFQPVTSLLFGWLDPGILGYRIVRLVLTLLASLVFAKGFWRWCCATNRNVNFLTILAITTSGSLLSYSLFPVSLSYNSWTLINMLLISGFIFSWISLIKAKSSPNKKSGILLLFVGLIIGLQFFVKFSAAGAYLFSIIALIIIIQKNDGIKWSRILTSILTLFGGIFLFMIIYFTTVESIFIWKEKFITAIKYTPAGYELDFLFEKYKKTLDHSFTKGVRNIKEVPIILFLLFTIGRMIGFFRPIGRTIYNVLFTGIMLYMLYYAYDNFLFMSGMAKMRNAFSIYLLILICTLCIVLAITTAKDIKLNITNPANRENIVIYLFLFFLPLCGSIGTSSILPINIIQYLYPWFLLILLISCWVSKKLQNNFYVNAFALIIGTFAFTQTVHGYVYSPYRLNSDLFHQTEEVLQLPKLEELKIETQSKDFILSINKIVQEKTKFSEGDPVIEIVDLPGIVYSLGGVSPGNSWYNPKYPNTNCYYLGVANIKALNKTLLFFYADERISEGFKNCLNEQGINYPNGYSKIGEVKHLHSDKTINIYAPK